MREVMRDAEHRGLIRGDVDETVRRRGGEIGEAVPDTNPDGADQQQDGRDEHDGRCPLVHVLGLGLRLLVGRVAFLVLHLAPTEKHPRPCPQHGGACEA